MFKTIALFWGVIFAIIAVVSAVWFIKWQFFTPRWDALLYSYENRGFDPVSRGPYWTEKECREEASKLIDQQSIFIDSKYKALRYFCGKDCYVDGFIGSVVIDEYECSEGLVPHLNSD